MNKIDKKSNIPLYMQLVDIFVEQIESNFEEGTKLDSEREICSKYNISRTTVRQALDELVKRGYLNKIQGKGNFISQKKLNQNLNEFYSFTEEMKKLGKVPESKILTFEIMLSNTKIAKKLNINKDDLIYKITRIRIADEIPMMYEITYLPYDRFLNLTNEILLSCSMYEIFRYQYNIKISHAEEILEPVLINRLESLYLNISEGSPGLKISRTTYNSDNEIVEYTISIAGGNKFEYKVYLKNI